MIETLEARGPFPFVTHRLVRAPDGSVVAWESRRHRKHENVLDTRRGSTWWAPGAVTWWIGVLFAIGSVCFALGAVPGYVNLVGTDADNVTFFVGSIFFTTAGLLQFLEVVNDSPGATRGPHDRPRLFALMPRRIDWWSTLVQLTGTAFFNISTFHALSTAIDAPAFDQSVWRPDARGSICFLVASALAWGEVGHRWWSWRPRDLGWVIAALNLLGSIAFGVSAVAAKVVDDGARSPELTNLGTFLGALCFLAGAILLLPERTADQVGSGNTAAS